MSQHLGQIEKLKIIARKVDYDLGLLAGAFGVCERQLERYFETELKLRPKEWVRDLRIHDACAPLVQGIQIKEVARRAGYKNPTHFARAFHQLMHMTPLQYFQQSRRESSQNVG